MKNLKNLTLAIITGMTMLASSCTPNEINPISDATTVMERIDIKIEGNETEYFFDESMQNEGTVDLVDYTFYNDQQGKIDFVVNLDQNKTLTVRVTNKLYTYPWEVLDSYGTFAPQDMDDKYKYVTVEYMDHGNSENSVFISNVSENMPQGGFLDVFRIEKYSNREKVTLCRLNNIVLYQINDPENSITIDGTFRGALTFI